MNQNEEKKPRVRTPQEQEFFDQAMKVARSEAEYDPSKTYEYVTTNVRGEKRTPSDTLKKPPTTEPPANAGLGRIRNYMVKAASLKERGLPKDD